MLARLKNDEKMRQAARGPLVYCAESIDNGEGWNASGLWMVWLYHK